MLPNFLLRMLEHLRYMYIYKICPWKLEITTLKSKSSAVSVMLKTARYGNNTWLSYVHYAEVYFYRVQELFKKYLSQTLLLLFPDFDALNQKQTQDLPSTTHNLIARLARSLMTDLK